MTSIFFKYFHPVFHHTFFQFYCSLQCFGTISLNYHIILLVYRIFYRSYSNIYFILSEQWIPNIFSLLFLVKEGCDVVDIYRSLLLVFGGVCHRTSAGADEFVANLPEHCLFFFREILLDFIYQRRTINTEQHTETLISLKNLKQLREWDGKSLRDKSVCQYTNLAVILAIWKLCCSVVSRPSYSRSGELWILFVRSIEEQFSVVSVSFH